MNESERNIKVILKCKSTPYGFEYERKCPICGDIVSFSDWEIHKQNYCRNCGYQFSNKNS